MSEDKSNQQLIIHSAKELTIKFPDKNPHISENEAEKTRSLIKSKGAYTKDGRGLMNKETLPHILATDIKGANRFYNDLDNEDKQENVDGLYVSINSISGEISKRIQEPRDTIIRERLKDNEQCLIAMRDAPELEKLREVEESKIKKELPHLKKKKIKAESLTNCQLTGQPLENNAAAHHIERKADNPRNATNLSNIVVINPHPHNEIHQEGAESKEELKELCEKKGWNYPMDD